MPKTTKIVLLIVVLIIIIGGIWYVATRKPKEEEVIKIGVITPLTGPAAEYGIATQKSLDLAMEELNNKGGINGRKIELIYENSECDPKKGIDALQKLISVNKINVVVGTVCSSVTLALAPIAEEQNILLISSGSSNPRISEYSNVFRTWPSDSLQGEFLANFVINNLKLKNVAIIFINNDYGVGLKDAFTEVYEQNGGKIVVAEAIPQGATDVKTQLTKIKDINPEGIFLATFAKEMGLILKQAKELGISAQFFGGEGTRDASVIEIGGEGTEGLIGTIPSTSSNQTRDHFLSVFQKKYKIEPGITGDAAYDILYLLNEIESECNGFSDINCVRNSLLSIKDFEGASGLIEFNQNGDVINKTYDLIQVKNDQFVPYEE